MKPTGSMLDYALNEIRARIQSGEYPPGTKLTTQEISDSLGISRTPVISAINRLVSLGLVEAIPRRGMMVAKMSPEQVQDVLEVRRMMELFAMSGALQTVAAQPESLEELRRMLDDFPPAYEKGDSAAEDVEFRFHSGYVALSGNKQLLELYKANWSVAAIFYFFFRTNQPAQHREIALQQHVQMVDALATGDTVMLSQSIQTHINSCYDLLDLYRAFNSQNTKNVK